MLPMAKQRKGAGNEAFPVWNPQSGLCPLEENRAFQACAGTHLFKPTVQQKKFVPIGTNFF